MTAKPGACDLADGHFAGCGCPAIDDYRDDPAWCGDCYQIAVACQCDDPPAHLDAHTAVCDVHGIACARGDELFWDGSRVVCEEQPAAPQYAFMSSDDREARDAAYGIDGMTWRRHKARERARAAMPTIADQQLM